MVSRQPVIILTRQERYSAWQLFILVHEIGHLALGHCLENQTVVDSKVQTNDDAEDVEANEFAVELLMGDGQTEFHVGPHTAYPKAHVLAGHARGLAEKYQVDPGAIVLNYGRTMGHFPVARAALKALEPNPSAIATIRLLMEERIPWANLSEEDGSLLRRLMLN